MPPEAVLKIQRHPNGTAIQGEWEPVFATIETCHQAVIAMGCPCDFNTVTIHTRTDWGQTLEDKVAGRLSQVGPPTRLSA